MHSTANNALAVALLSSVIAACSHGAATTHERLAMYREHAGAPISSIQVDQRPGRFEWTPLGDQALAIWPGAHRGYLLELRTSCPAILTAPRVSITHSWGQVAARLDSLMMRSASGTMTSACRIGTIRPLEGRALYEATRDLREVDVVDRSQLSPGQASPLR